MFSRRTVWAGARVGTTMPGRVLGCSVNGELDGVGCRVLKLMMRWAENEPGIGAFREDADATGTR